MRMIWQAVRAVTIEVMGVGVVIFMLFGAAGWTVESAGVQPKQEVERAWQWVQDTTDDVAASIKPKLTDDERQRFAEDRLDYYSQLYGEAANSYASQTAERFDVPVKPADKAPALPRNQLLGTL